uniref:Cytochrome P450, family 2, subfamily X, polypeptide 9 n=1 Tax=Maylandia zebra TaxID=106582 RepID=A0A3P9CH19_9CICH
MRKSYGDVYSIFIGCKPAVVINGVKAMKEAMVTKAADFAGRPQGVIMADYGSKWREQRRFALMTLRNFGLGKNSMGERIHDEIKHIISTLEKNVGMFIDGFTQQFSSNIICQVLFARRYKYDDELIKLFVEVFTEVSKIVNGPWATVSKTDSNAIEAKCLQFPNRSVRLPGIYKNLSRRMVSEHRETRVPGEPRDFIDCYLDELEKVCELMKSAFQKELIMYSLNLHFAGTGTTSNTLLTGFLYLMNYPHIQGNTTPPVLIYNQEKFNLLAHL